VKVQLSIDRFEGKHKEIAVLLTDDGRQLDFPRDLLPRAAKAGEVITLTVERDQEATLRLKQETRKIQKKLDERDPGGDIEI